MRETISECGVILGVFISKQGHGARERLIKDPSTHFPKPDPSFSEYGERCAHENEEPLVYITRSLYQIANFTSVRTG